MIYTIIQIMGIGISIVGIISLLKKNRDVSLMRMMPANIGCLILNIGYLMLMTSKSEEAAFNAFRMAYIGNVLFYFFVAFFVASYLHINNKKILWGAVSLWLILDGLSLLAIFVKACQPWLFEDVLFRRLPDGLMEMHIESGPLYRMRYALISAVFLIGIIYSMIKMFLAKSRIEKYNLARLVGIQFVNCVSLNVSLLSKLPYDIIPIFASLSSIAVILNCVHGGFYNVADNGRNDIIEHSDNVYIITDNSCRMLNINEKAKNEFEELRNLRENHKLPKSILEIMDLDRGTLIEQNGRIYQKHLVTLEHKGEIIGYALKLLDVTVQQQLMQEVVQEKERADAANEAKSAFLANMSHEIRTPMNAIVGMTDILLREKHEQQTREYLVNIKNSSAALLTIINDILDFSKIESGKMEIIEEEYAPMSVFHDLSMIFLNRIGDKQVELLYDIDKDMPARLWGDAQRLRQIVINLMNNAIKFTDSGCVRLRVELGQKHDDSVDISFYIEDSGQGIKEEDIGKLFGTFQQVDTKKNHHKEGTGLGLSISKRLVEMMHGEIGVKSVYGEGSTFFFTVPQRIVEEKPETFIKRDVKETGSICLRISNRLVREQLEKLAASYGIDCVETAADIPSFVRYVIADHPDAVSREERERYKKEDITYCILQNPMTENYSRHKALIINKPVYSLNFCHLINHEEITYQSHVEETFNFIAPKAKILIVDDNEMNIKVAMGLLEPYRMQLDSASNGKEALEMVKENHYDMVFMDHMMPVMDGIEATGEIRKLEEKYYQKLPIVALSANATTEAREMFVKAQLNDFVAKPIQLKEICKCILKWLPQDLVEEVTAENESDNMRKGDVSEENELPEIEGLDVFEGIKNCGTKELFISLLGDFYKLIDSKTVKLEKCLADEMLRDYTIEVHALKNTARMIGAMELSGLFYELEQLGNAGELEQIKEKSPKAIELFNSYKPVLSEYANRQQQEKEQVSKDILYQTLVNIHNAIDTFDLDKAVEAMKELEGYAVPDELLPGYEKLTVYMADLAMEDILKVTDEMCEIIK